MKHIRKIGIVSLGILLLSGCTSTPPITIEGMQLSPMNPESIQAKVEKINSESSSSAHVFVTNANAEILMSGSSSCPPRITKVKESSSGLDIYVMKPELGKPCTSDLRHFGWAGVFSSLETAKNTTFARVIIGDDPSTDDIKSADFTRVQPSID